MSNPARSAITYVPGLGLADLSREVLAVLGREWLLHGHLQDRVAMPLVLSGGSRALMEQVAIDEWMSASPIYSKRMQRALRFEGDGVDTIMKNLQLEIGSPHQFMDFRCTVHDHDHGEFLLAHCGALMDVEPMGVDFVHGMCHTMEDPTFDATAGATNPHAQVRPIHRPPRVPANRHPHCQWTIAIDPESTPAEPHPNLARVGRSLAARCAVDDPDRSGESGGWDDYAGSFDTDFAFEDLSHRALVVALQEIALQSHLLLRGRGLSITERIDAPSAAEITVKTAVGLAGLTAERLAGAFDLPPGAPGLAIVLAIHPMFWPRTYVEPVVQVEGGGVHLALKAGSPMFAEDDELTWFSRTPGSADRAFLALAQGFDRRAQLVPVAPQVGERCAYRITVDPGSELAREQPEVSLGKFSTGASFRFHGRALRR